MVRRTVEALRGVRDVRDAEIACEHEHADGEVQPRTWAGVRERDLDEGEHGVHHVFGDVRER